jgi:hypothetical protein
VSNPGPADAPREVLSLIHHHPGRLRVRAAAFREGGAAARVRAALEATPGITALSHNARTGSLLVEYQPGLADPEAILARIAAAAGLGMPADDERARHKEPALLAIEVTREVNEIIHEVTGYRADLRALVPAGMAVLAGYSLYAHKESKLPRWDNLLYWSYNVFTQLHRREIEAAAAAPRSPPEGAVEPAPAPASKPGS